MSAHWTENETDKLLRFDSAAIGVVRLVRTEWYERTIFSKENDHNSTLGFDRYKPFGLDYDNPVKFGVGIEDRNNSAMILLNGRNWWSMYGSHSGSLASTIVGNGVSVQIGFDEKGLTYEDDATYDFDEGTAMGMICRFYFDEIIELKSFSKQPVLA